MKACPSCGEQNSEKAKFCLECDAALVDAPPRQEERKVVTVLFADLVGFTARSEAMDVEDVRGTLQPYHQLLRRELERPARMLVGGRISDVPPAPPSCRSAIRASSWRVTARRAAVARETVAETLVGTRRPAP